MIVYNFVYLLYHKITIKTIFQKNFYYIKGFIKCCQSFVIKTNISIILTSVLNLHIPARHNIYAQSQNVRYYHITGLHRCQYDYVTQVCYTVRNLSFRQHIRGNNR